MCDRPAAAKRSRSVGDSSCMSAMRRARTSGASSPKCASMPRPMAERQRARMLAPRTSVTLALVMMMLPRAVSGTPRTRDRDPAVARPRSTATRNVTPHAWRPETNAPGLASDAMVTSHSFV